MAEPSDPTERFSELVALPEEELPLGEAALCIAAHGRPSLDVSQYVDRLAVLAGRVPTPTVPSLVDLLFLQEGLRGNTEAYYEPENSYLDCVLERRKGIPISLAVVAIEVGKRAGIAVAGVSLPGHFLICATVDSEPWYLDPFRGGQRLEVADCQALLRTSAGPALNFSPEMLAPVGPRVILARMLANLKAIAIQQNDPAFATWVLRLRTRIPGVPLEERRELARLLSSRGDLLTAANEWESLASLTTGAAAADASSRANQLRALLN